MTAPASRQRGAALLVMLLLFVLGATWFLISRFDSLNANQTARERDTNATVLRLAKRALIGYTIAQANKSGEDNPGALPCPEHAWYIDYNDKAGTMGPSTGVSSPGYGTANCSSIGRFPWRTIGTDMLVDAVGEPLWYVVGPTWRKTSTSTKTTINSNTAGDLTVDGQQVVALISAPGRPMNSAAGTTTAGVTCSARNQARVSPVTSAVDPLDYLECYNSATLAFTASGPSASTNDQVVAITAADLMPGIEASVANRMEREITPVLKTVYASASWGAAVSATHPVYPYPADFNIGNPSTSNYHGAAGLSAGLLPFFQTQGCNPATDPRCTTATTGGSAFLVFSKSGADTYQTLVPPLPLGWIRTDSTCSWSGQTYSCTGEYQLTSIKVTLVLRVTNVAMGLRTFDSSKITCTAVDDAGAGIPQQNLGCTSSVALQSNGSALVTVTTGWTPDIVTAGWGTYANYTISFDRAVFGDHSLLDSNNATTGWFVRNEWYRLLYYVVASGYTAAALPSATACTTGTNCLTVTNVTPAGAQRALLILTGASLNGTTRPSGTLANYLEAGNATGSYVKKEASTGNAIPVASRFNDRLMVVDSN